MNIKSMKGMTLIEVMATVFIMSILGIMVFSFVQTGGTLYRDTYESYEGRTQARNAISYITFKIRQNDAAGCIEIKESENSLIIKNKESKPIFKINCEKSSLIEHDECSGKTKKIANIKSFNINKSEDNMTIQVEVGYLDGDEKVKKLNETIALRCIE